MSPPTAQNSTQRPTAGTDQEDLHAEALRIELGQRTASMFSELKRT